MGKKTPSDQPRAPPTALATDSRFTAALTDARFQRFPKKRQTVAIDERFKGALPCGHAAVHAWASMHAGACKPPDASPRIGTFLLL